MIDTMLYSREKAMKLLNLGEKAFNAMQFPYVQCGKRKKYLLELLKEHLDKQIREATCQLKRGQNTTTTRMTSRSTVIGFAEAVKQTTRPQQRQ